MTAMLVSQLKSSYLSEVNFGTSFSLTINVYHLEAMRAKAVEIIVSTTKNPWLKLIFSLISYTA